MSKFRRALLSVSNKSGLADFAQGLDALGIELLSSGGTARALEAVGLKVKRVSDWTESPEMLGGRVKTLHPRIHGGILARRDHEADQADCKEHQIEPIDLVVVNLYPFEQAAAKGVSEAELIEEIDIGGPTLLRAAAKNHQHVAVLCDPTDYADILKELKDTQTLSLVTRQRLALKAFERTARYDAAIVQELSERLEHAADHHVLMGVKVRELRYGENPHQRASLFSHQVDAEGLAGADLLNGKALSYNNLVDADGAWSFVRDFGPNTACVVKHAAPCGASRASSLVEAVEGAFRGDPLSAFGGIVAVNETMTLEAAKAITKKGRFVEVVIAPDYEQQALARLKRKKAMRVLKVDQPVKERTMLRCISGGFLVQDLDLDHQEQWNVVGEHGLESDDLASLEFAVHCVKFVRSNAIVLTQGLELVGVGGGQPSRVDAVHIAVRKAGERSQGAILASDAFFPFPDGVEAAAKAGVKIVIQPGGSKRDDEVTAAANRLGLVMIHTGRRHFLH